jgi:DNA-binding NtrC family response regulator
VRIIAATNEALDDRISKGLFRDDLYYRLAEFVISLPPLRERREDILPLARAFLGEATVELKRPASVITEGAADLLRDCPWPGNVRQLRNVMRRAALQTTGVAIDAKDLQSLLQAASDSNHEPVATVHAAPSSAAWDAAPAAVSNGGRSLKDIAKVAFEAAEKQAIMEALRTTGGHKQKAALLLQTDYKTLFVKLKRYGLGNAHFKME